MKIISVKWNTLKEPLGYKLNWKLYLRMLRTNDESHIGLQPDERARRELDIPMAIIRERLEAMCSGNGRGTTSREEKTL